MRIAPLAVLLSGLAASSGVRATAAAQEQRAGGSIPASLAIALLSGDVAPDMPAARITVGRAPDGFPAELIPASPASVAGGTVTGWHRTVVLAFPTTADSAMTSYAAQLERAGWRKAALVANLEGFVPSDLPRHLLLCRESARVMVATAPGAATGSYIRATHFSDSGGGGCSERGPLGVRDSLFPALRAPEGARMRGGSGGFGGDDAHIATRIVTPLGLTAILSHYGNQLRAAGWTVSASLSTEELAVQRVSMRDRRGREWRGTLTVTALQDDCKDVQLRVARAEGS